MSWEDDVAPWEADDDDHEESDEEISQRRIEEHCEQCRLDAERYGDGEPDCAICGIIDDEPPEASAGSCQICRQPVRAERRIYGDQLGVVHASCFALQSHARYRLRKDVETVAPETGP